MNSPRFFDGHNDVLTRLFKSGGVDAVQNFVNGGTRGHIDLPRARIGGLAGGFFAVWIPETGNLGDIIEEMRQPSYDLPLPEPVPQPAAMKIALEQAATLNRLEGLGALRICLSVDQIEECVQSGKLAAIFHMEGAEAIDPDFEELGVLWRAGLRSIGPVWSRSTLFGEGVPFRFPSSPDIGGGLTAHGKKLIAKCNRLGIMVDLSHINEAGFWDIAEISDAPLVATHSNAHAICPHSRNLTDSQLAAIAVSDGMVGLNFATALLREDGRMVSQVPLEQMIRHLDHLIGILGEDRVGLGSDFDGATVPEAIGDASGLPKLASAMRDHGYGAELINKICFDNWMRVLRKTWK